jgi:hypothetical protein
MITTSATTLSDFLRRLPEDPAARALALQRLTDTYAAGEAIVALRSAADAAAATGGPLAAALASAAALWDGRGFGKVDDEAAARALRQLLEAVTSPAFLAVIPDWVLELRQIAGLRPGTGACTIATGLQLWAWTMRHMQQGTPRHETAITELANASCWLLAARCQVLQMEVLAPPAAAGSASFSADLSHALAARAAAIVATTCAEIVYGYRRHPSWDAEGCSSCYAADDLDELEGLMPGIASSARAHADVVEADGSHAAKAGPCVRVTGLEEFARLRAKLDGCMTGARLAKDRAAAALDRGQGRA